MPKFRATSIKDFLTDEACAGRIARKAPVVVCVEVDDGSWCELDAENSQHARLLAETWVSVHNARGASCWIVMFDGKLSSFPFYLVVENLEDETRDFSVITNREVSGI